MSDAALRTFVAVPLPPPVINALEDLSGRIRSAGLRGRWVPAKNIHLTIAFLGDTAASAVAPLGEALTEAAASSVAFDLVPAGLGVFPGPRRARVLWVGLNGEVTALAALTRAVHNCLVPLGFENSKRSATGHLTLARARGEFDSRPLAAVLDAHRSFAGPSFRVEALVLYHSALGSGPARYTPLATAVVGGAGIPCDTGGRK